MSTRVRVSLKHVKENITTTGDEARKMLATWAANVVLWKDGLPANWKDLKYRERLKYLKQFIPPEWVMEVYVEPKATRPSRSAFRQSVKARKKASTIQWREVARDIEAERIVYEAAQAAVPVAQQQYRFVVDAQRRRPGY
jgi:hypothetical protein